MTIPSIGGNSFSNRLKPVSVSDSSADEIDIQLNQTTQEKEYSIAQFKRDYAELLYGKVLPIIAGFETERKQRLGLAIFCVILCLIVAVCIFVFIEGFRSGEFKLICACFVAAFALWSLIKKSFEKKIKKKIMPTLMQAFPGFYWQETPPVSADEIVQCNIFPDAKNASKTFDDCFIGNYRNVPLAVSECELSIRRGNSTETIFEGVCVKIKMNKKFEGLTIIRPKKASYNNKCTDLKKLKLEEVKLEDPIFEKEYYVFSSDQIEARYLITTTFMERLKQIEDAFFSEYTYCAFYGDSVYIAPHSGCDLFSLCSLTKPITNTDQFAVLLDEFVSILNLVDHFKLDNNLGL